MWLMDQVTLANIRATLEGANISQYSAHAAKLTGAATDRNPVLSTANGVATIRIHGALLPTENAMYTYFGIANTGYDDIQAALISAQGDPNVESIELDTRSGGGTIEGLFETIDAMRAVAKPVNAMVAGMAASAAYALVATADTITAKGIATSFGSIGVVIDTYVSEHEVSLTSTAAPRKRPDLKTEEGRKMVVAQLDDIHELFAEAVAVGRGVTSQQVNADFGQGGMFLAQAALKAGMIDAVEKPQTRQTKPKQTAVQRGTKSENSKVNLETLKAEHPALYAMVIEEGRKQGADAERVRASAHLTLGNASGDLALAIEAVENGDECDALYTAKYNAANMRQTARADIAADDEGSTASDQAAPVATTQEQDDQCIDDIFDMAATGNGLVSEV